MYRAEDNVPRDNVQCIVETMFRDLVHKILEHENLIDPSFGNLCSRLFSKTRFRDHVCSFRVFELLLFSSLFV